MKLINTFAESYGKKQRSRVKSEPMDEDESIDGIEDGVFMFNVLKSYSFHSIVRCSHGGKQLISPSRWLHCVFLICSIMKSIDYWESHGPKLRERFWWNVSPAWNQQTLLSASRRTIVSGLSLKPPFETVRLTIIQSPRLPINIPQCAACTINNHCDSLADLLVSFSYMLRAISPCVPHGRLSFANVPSNIFGFYPPAGQILPIKFALPCSCEISLEVTIRPSCQRIGMFTQARVSGVRLVSAQWCRIHAIAHASP